MKKVKQGIYELTGTDGMVHSESFTAINTEVADVLIREIAKSLSKVTPLKPRARYKLTSGSFDAMPWITLEI